MTEKVERGWDAQAIRKSVKFHRWKMFAKFGRRIFLVKSGRDLTRPHPLNSGKSRLVKYYFIWPDICFRSEWFGILSHQDFIVHVGFYCHVMYLNSKQGITPLKANMAMEISPFEDVFPIESGDFPASHVS